MFIHPVHIIIFLSAIALVSLAWAYRASRRGRLAERSAGGSPADVDALQARVAVLEKIATDPAARLDREIEALRTAS